MMDKIVSYAKQKAKDYELFYVKFNTLTAELNNDKVDFVNEGATHGICARVFVDGKLGLAYTNDLEKFRECVDNAIKIAKINKPDPHFKSFAKRSKISKVATLNKKVRDIDADDVKDFTHAFVKSVKDVRSDIVVCNGSFVRDVQEVHVINSQGVDFFEVAAKNNFYAYLALKHNGELEQTSHDMGSRDLLKANGKEDAQRLLQNLGKKHVDSMDCPVVLLPQTSAGLLDAAYGFAVNAEHVQQKKSVWSEKVGQQVFSQNVNIMDDAVTDGLYASRSADVEGVPSRSQHVIQKGVLKGLLHNTYTAYKEQSDSTGNSYRSLGTAPAIAPTNVIVSGGKAKDVVAEVDKGVVLRTVLGTHTMNEVTGDFSLGILEGYYVEKGEVKFPIKDAMVAGNFFTMMNQLVAMNKKQEHVLEGNGGFYLPAMLISRLKIIGK